MEHPLLHIFARRDLSKELRIQESSSEDLLSQTTPALHDAAIQHHIYVLQGVLSANPIHANSMYREHVPRGTMCLLPSAWDNGKWSPHNHVAISTILVVLSTINVSDSVDIVLP